MSRKPNAISDATQRIKRGLNNLKSALPLIDDNLIRGWVDDLVVVKSFTGLRFQSAILNRVSKVKGTSFRLARPDEESKGIDGYIGREPVSIKPETYKIESDLPESIRIPIIYYKKLKTGIRIDASSVLGKQV